MKSPGVLLTAQQLSVGYGDHILLDNLSLTLHAGELVCFMGPNGVGKSTLIRTLAGLQRPQKGTISSTHSKMVSIVLTDRISVFNMTVFDLVCFGRYPYLDWRVRLSAADRLAVDTALEQANLLNLAQKKLHELSDGQMQLALIARALAQDTPIVLLDEPTAHLDLNHRIEIMNLLRNLAVETGKSILVATHELDLALQTAHLIWLATGDKTIKTGIPEDLILDGSFDEVFQFKGYDLRTGKISQLPFRRQSVHLEGEGHVWRWTKNALERCGYSVSEQSALKIVVTKGERLHWMFDGKTYERLADVLAAINTV